MEPENRAGFIKSLGNLWPAEKRLEYVMRILGSMIQNPSYWDESCKFTIEKFKGEFSMAIKSRHILDAEMNDILFKTSVSFLFENYFTGKGDPNFTGEIRHLFEQVHRIFDAANNSDTRFYTQFLPVWVLKRCMDSLPVSSMANLIKQSEEKLAEMNFSHQRLEGDIHGKDMLQQQVDELKITVDQIRVDANFALLNEGFDRINQTKRTEEKVESESIGFAWTAIIAIPIITIFLNAVLYILDIDSTFRIIASIAMFSIEIFVLYYLRIHLAELKSIRAQIVQLELRKSLCGFIQTYAEFSKDFKDKNENAMDKFEAIIFSNIVADPGQIPPTIDGLDQIAKLVKAVRN